jgi:hypothetical protein
MMTAIICLTIVAFFGIMYANWRRREQALISKARQETKERIDSMKKEIEAATKEAADAKKDFNTVYDAYRRQYNVSPRDPGTK